MLKAELETLKNIPLDESAVREAPGGQKRARAPPGERLSRSRPQPGPVLTGSLLSKAILYLGAEQLEVRIMAVPDWGASFTVYQPGFVITARELKWHLRSGNPKGRTGNIENGTEREQIGNTKYK